MSLEVGAWGVKEENESRILLTRGEDRTHVSRDDDDLAGERWFFDFDPLDGEPATEQFRVENRADLFTEIERLLKRYSSCNSSARNQKD